MSEDARYWLKPTSGPELRVPDRGILFGRAPECDVILSDRKASKHHALLRPSLRGLDLFPLGRNPTRVNGVIVERHTRLRPRDSLALPGGRWRVEVQGDRDPAPVWQLDVAGGSRCGLRWLPFSVGGGDMDHLRIAGWPPVALRFLRVQGTLVAEIGVALRAGGVPMPEGALDLPAHGDRYERDGVTLTLLSAGRGAGSRDEQERLPSRVRFTFLTDGGRLSLEYPDGGLSQVALDAPEGRLLAALLAPPPSAAAGDWIPDEVLIPAIGAGRGGELSRRLHRLRRALAGAGVDPALLERTRRGGAARLRLAPGALVAVR